MPDSEDPHFLGLDLLRLMEADGKEHCAILLEIWRSGGILQTSDAIAAGSCVEIALETGPVTARVQLCTRDAYGCIIEVSVDSPTQWFAGDYSPPYLLPPTKPGIPSQTE